MALPGPAIAVAQQRVVDAEILDDRQFAVAVIPVIGRFSVAEHPIADAVFIGLGEQIHIVENEALDLEVAAENGKERHLGLDMAEFEHFWARSPGGVFERHTIRRQRRAERDREIEIARDGEFAAGLLAHLAGDDILEFIGVLKA